jgi:hypothetical protein
MKAFGNFFKSDVAKAQDNLNRIKAEATAAKKVLDACMDHWIILLTCTYDVNNKKINLFTEEKNVGSLDIDASNVNAALNLKSVQTQQCANHPPLIKFVFTGLDFVEYRLEPSYTYTLSYNGNKLAYIPLTGIILQSLVAGPIQMLYPWLGSTTGGGYKYTSLNRKGVCSDGKERSLYRCARADAKALYVKRMVKLPGAKTSTVKYVPFVPMAPKTKKNKEIVKK